MVINNIDEGHKIKREGNISQVEKYKYLGATVWQTITVVGRFFNAIKFYCKIVSN